MIKKKLTDWFDQVYLINLKSRPDRLLATLGHLESQELADITKVIVAPAVQGTWTSIPACWDGPVGAWGCMRSHQNVLEAILHSRDERDDIIPDTALILEDDVFFLDNALEDLAAFMEAVPADWGQLYLGGQHRRPLTKTDSPLVMTGGSVNRTHAYAVSRPYVQKIYQHISHIPDYKNRRHIDHQLELAHRRGDWPIYHPAKWICGQRAGRSDISNADNPAFTWS